MLQEANALAAFLDTKDIILREDDLIAGYHQVYDCSPPPGEPTLHDFCRDTDEHQALMDEFEKGVRIGPVPRRSSSRSRRSTTASLRTAWSST